MKEKLLKEFSEWLNEEDRQNWEIERYVEAMLDEIFDNIITIKNTNNEEINIDKETFYRKMIRLTPCCKTQFWRPVSRFDILQEGKPAVLAKCELCEKYWDFNALLLVVNNINPVTYFCDKCYKSLFEIMKEQENLNNERPNLPNN
jgi:hypothetical protein